MYKKRKKSQTNCTTLREKARSLKESFLCPQPDANGHKSCPKCVKPLQMPYGSSNSWVQIYTLHKKSKHLDQINKSDGIHLHPELLYEDNKKNCADTHGIGKTQKMSSSSISKETQ
jgi:hypothetical protein